MLWPGLLTLAGFLLAFLPLLLKRPDLPDVLVLAPIVAGAAWAWWIWGRKHEWLAVPLLLSAGAAFQIVWMFFLASYGAAEAGVAPGETAPDFEVRRVRDGAVFRLAAQRGHGVLLVFSRGHW